MGLIKQKTLSNGVIIDYWHIKKYEHLVKNGHPYIKFYLCGYLDKASATNCCDYMDVYEFNYIGDEYDTHFALSTLTRDDIYNLGYQHIKESKLDENENETNFFVDAVDDL